MAGNMKRDENRQNGASGAAAKRSSRVSGAADVTAPRIQSIHAEQRAHLPNSKRGSSSSANKGSGQGRQAQGGGSNSTRKRPGGSRSSSPPHDNTGDSRFIRTAFDQWNGMEAHQRQRIFSVLLLLLSLLLFGALTIFRTTPILRTINGFFLAFFGWGAYVLALGLVAFAVAHLIEGMQRRIFVSWRLVIGLTCIWLILMAESRLIMGHMSVGILAELLVTPLLGWDAAIGHLLLFGLLLIFVLFTFRITLGQLVTAGRYVFHAIAHDSRQEAEAEAEEDLTPFMGQRPQYSRYGATPLPPPLAEEQTPAKKRASARPEAKAAAKPLSSRRPPLQEEHEFADEEDASIEFEADFDDDDPENDINIHKSKIGNVPRGPRAAIDTHVEAVKGAKQSPLPFQSPLEEDEEDEQQAPLILSQHNAHNRGKMEDLQPNPSKVPVPVQPRTRAAQQPAPIPESPWKLPDTSLLNNPEEVKQHMLGDDTATLARTIQETLRSFRVDAEVRAEDISIGPTVIRFGIRPTGKPEMTMDEKGHPVPVRDAQGNIIYETRTRVSRIMALQNDLALVLEAKTIRMEAPVPGRPYVGVEIPNKNSRLVTLREVLESKEYQVAKAKSKLAIALGKDVAGQVRVGDLARMPHLLIAGATGAGKSVAINIIIASIITHAVPDDVRLLMVDPKMVELSMYNGIPHLLAPVVTEVDKVVPLLKNAINEMERRYRLFSQLGVRNLDGYRKLRAEKLARGDESLSNMPAIVIIIDELADLMMAAPEEVEGMICRLAQLARATGIHLVIATQRPSVDVITGLIKANIPTRISFMVSSAVDSRTIIDMGGAERLLGRGDMLYLPADAGRPERIQCSFLTDDEAETLVTFWREQRAQHALETQKNNSDPALALTQPIVEVEPGWEIKEQAADDFELDDDLLEQAEEVVREYGKASISLLQRRLRIGYSRAARLIDLLEEHGIIGHAESGGRGREVFEGNGGSSDRFGDSHSMADEVADIAAEERARDEFLKQQAARQNNQPSVDDKQ